MDSVGTPSTLYEKIEKFCRNRSIYSTSRLSTMATALQIRAMFHGHGIVDGGRWHAPRLK